MSLFGGVNIDPVLLQGLAVAFAAGIPLGCMVVLVIRDWRRQMRIDQSPQYPAYETLKPGQQPILKGCLGYKQGGLITITCFGNLNAYPRLSDPKPPTLPPAVGA